MKPKPEPPKEPPKEPPAAPSEDERVRRWRQERLLELGVDELCAFGLSFHTDAVHRVATLIAKGCEPTLAARIVI